MERIVERVLVLIGCNVCWGIGNGEGHLPVLMEEAESENPVAPWSPADEQLANWFGHCQGYAAEATLRYRATPDVTVGKGKTSFFTY